jgi:hypothetical protein
MTISSMPSVEVRRATVVEITAAQVQWDLLTSSGNGHHVGKVIFPWPSPGVR